MADLGDTLYRDSSVWKRLPGNITTDLQVLTQTGDGVNSAPPVWAVLTALLGSGRLLNVQVFGAGSVTYHPVDPTNTSFVLFILNASGGSGSGVLSAAANQVNLGGAGGGGETIFVLLTADFDGGALVVGAGVTGGAAGNNNGSDGNDTTFTDTAGSPTTYTAHKGLKGTPRTSFAPPITNTGGAGGTGGNGNLLNIDGETGGAGVAPNQFVGYSSGGGPSHFSPRTEEAQVVNAGSAVGFNGHPYGAGGGGAVSSNAGGSKAGGDSSDGFALFLEFS